MQVVHLGSVATILSHFVELTGNSGKQDISTVAP